MASCVRNIRTKNYQNLVIAFLVTVKNIGNVFWRHGVYTPQTTKQGTTHCRLDRC